MRDRIFVVVLMLALALGAGFIISRRSTKAIGPALALLLGSLLPPIIGNLIIIASRSRLTAIVGCYIYYLGMDCVMYALLGFTMAYCRLTCPGTIRRLVSLLLVADAVQLLCNPFFGHAFGTESVMVDGAAYYRIIPYAGQGVHRAVDYALFAAVLLIFLVKMVRVPRVYSERYSIILLTMILAGMWETYYIFSRTPIDRSMIGFGVFGLLVFYFSLYYRPVRLLEQMLAYTASEMTEALFFFDATGRCVWANSPGIELVKLDENDFEQGPECLNRVFGPLDLGASEWCCRRTLGSGEAARYYELEKRAVADERRRTVGSFLSVRDETERQREFKRELYNANHDRLTGLYTREHLYERVVETLRENPDVSYCACYLDVNEFKLFNDVFGNAFGDIVLQRIAQALQRDLPRGCVYGRLSGDTFGMLIPAADFEEELTERTLSGFSVSHDGLEQRVEMHEGVYEITEPDLDVSVMFDRAHMALSTIKQEYKRHIAFYDEEMREKVLWDKHITGELRTALEERQILPYLQALVDCSGRIVGAEALVRWQHPQHGFLAPSAFVPVFEKNGMIADVDRYMWRRACELLSRWEREGRGGLFLSVNISPKDFYFMDVVSELKQIVAEYGVDPARLRVEITETVMMTDNENRIRILDELKTAGFMVEMDDFGSGYSSLNMLKDMPVDVVKIDMMFLNKTRDGERARKILRNMIHLTDDLGIASLTEGVETESQYRMLTGMGCKLFQGYFFARPMPVEEFEARWLPIDGELPA